MLVLRATGDDKPEIPNELVSGHSQPSTGIAFRAMELSIELHTREDVLNIEARPSSLAHRLRRDGEGSPDVLESLGKVLLNLITARINSVVKIASEKTSRQWGVGIVASLLRGCLEPELSGH